MTVVDTGQSERYGVVVSSGAITDEQAQKMWEEKRMQMPRCGPHILANCEMKKHPRG